MSYRPPPVRQRESQVCHAAILVFMAVEASAASAAYARAGLLVAVNLAVVRDDLGPKLTKPTETGIDKRPSATPVWLRTLGVDGDAVCNRRVHGGPDQAAYAYDLADTDWWQRELGAELGFSLRPGSFGENLSTSGLAVTEAVIGERWQIGAAVLEISRPRIPCSTFAAFWGVPGLVRRFTAAGRPGAYLRVIAEGQVSAGDPITVLSRPEHGLTVRETFRAMTGDRSLAAKLLTASELPERIRADARGWLAG
jgi:MOSC domain-containing protein YiiM